MRVALAFTAPAAASSNLIPSIPSPANYYDAGRTTARGGGWGSVIFCLVALAVMGKLSLMWLEWRERRDRRRNKP